MSIKLENKTLPLPLVSVGLPTYNRGFLLKCAIESVLNQDYPNIELIISDNASTDETMMICQETCRKDNQVRYFRQPYNIGPTKNFINVLSEAKGDFFMWLSDDDWIDSSYISACVTELNSDPMLVSVGGIGKSYEDDVFLNKCRPINLDQPKATDRVLAYFAEVGDNSILFGVTRREQLIRILMRNTMGADWLLVAALAFIGKLKTLNSVSIHRNRKFSSSSSIKKIRTTLGLPIYQQFFPHISIAVSAFSDIVWKNPVFADLNNCKRYFFGARVFLQIIFFKGIIQNTKAMIIKIIEIFVGEDGYKKIRFLILGR